MSIKYNFELGREEEREGEKEGGRKRGREDEREGEKEGARKKGREAGTLL